MFTIMKIRDNITSYKDPGWYKSEAPPGTVAEKAVAAQLQRDGVNLNMVPAVIRGPSSPAAAPE
jgi:hypothetical protein